MTYNVATVGLNMFKLKKNIVYTVSRQPKNAAYIPYKWSDNDFKNWLKGAKNIIF